MIIPFSHVPNAISGRRIPHRSAPQGGGPLPIDFFQAKCHSHFENPLEKGSFLRRLHVFLGRNLTPGQLVFTHTLFLCFVGELGSLEFLLAGSSRSKRKTQEGRGKMREIENPTEARTMASNSRFSMFGVKNDSQNSFQDHKTEDSEVSSTSSSWAIVNGEHHIRDTPPLS